MEAWRIFSRAPKETDHARPVGHLRAGDRTVKRIGYGAMQLAGPGSSDRPRTVARLSPCCERPSTRGSIISTRAITTVRTSRTRLFVKRFTRIRPISSSLPRSVPCVEATAHGSPPKSRRISPVPSMTIAATSGLTRSRSSIFASWAMCTILERNPSRVSSRRWQSCSARAPFATWAQQRHRGASRRGAQHRACRLRTESLQPGAASRRWADR